MTTLLYLPYYESSPVGAVKGLFVAVSALICFQKTLFTWINKGHIKVPLPKADCSFWLEICLGYARIGYFKFCIMQLFTSSALDINSAFCTQYLLFESLRKLLFCRFLKISIY